MQLIVVFNITFKRNIIVISLSNILSSIIRESCFFRINSGSETVVI